MTISPSSPNSKFLSKFMIAFTPIIFFQMSPRSRLLIPEKAAIIFCPTIKKVHSFLSEDAFKKGTENLTGSSFALSETGATES